MAALIEEVARTMAEFWNGGDWTDENYYTEEQRDKWRSMAKVVIAKIEGMGFWIR